MPTTTMMTSRRASPHLAAVPEHRPRGPDPWPEGGRRAGTTVPVRVSRFPAPGPDGGRDPADVPDGNAPVGPEAGTVRSRGSPGGDPWDDARGDTRISLDPASAFEAVTRQMVDGLRDDVAEIKGRLDGLLWLLAGAIALDVMLRLGGV